VIVPSWSLIVARTSRVMTRDMEQAKNELIRLVVAMVR
jgi:hypothetical protein